MTVGSNPTSSAFASPKLLCSKGGKDIRLGYGLASPKLCQGARDEAAYTKLHMQYVYVLFCSDDHTYIGCTHDLKDRLRRHNKGLIPATKERLPVTLSCYFAFQNKYTAFNFEKYLKTASGRAFLKKRLI